MCGDYRDPSTHRHVLQRIIRKNFQRGKKSNKSKRSTGDQQLGLYMNGCALLPWFLGIILSKYSVSLSGFLPTS